MAEDARQVREQIAQERAELGETVRALAEKADVKGRIVKKAEDSVEQAQEKAAQVAGQVQHAAQSVTPEPVAAGVHTATETVRRRPLPVAAVALAVVVVAVILGWRQRQRG